MAAYRLLRAMKKYLCFGYMLRSTGLRNENNSRLDGSGDEHNFDSESELCGDLNHSSKNGSSSSNATDNEMSSTGIDPHEEPDKCARGFVEEVEATASTSASSSQIVQQQQSSTQTANINRRQYKGSGQSIDTVMTNLSKINENSDAAVVDDASRCGEIGHKLITSRFYSQPAVHVYVLENRKATEQRSLIIDGNASEIVIVAVAPMMMQRRASVGSLNFERKPFW